MDLSCGHCGFGGRIDSRGTLKVNSEVEEVDEGRHTLHWETQVHAYLCPACSEPTVWSSVWSPEIGEHYAERRLYPTLRDNSALPEKVRARLDAALKVKKIEPGFYAVGIRRMLETVCNTESASGENLFEKLDDLVAKGRMPASLAEAAHELRRLGNLGAHDEDLDVATDDVPAIEALAEAILEFLYRAPSQLAAVRDALAARRGN